MDNDAFRNILTSMKQEISKPAAKKDNKEKKADPKKAERAAYYKNLQAKKALRPEEMSIVSKYRDRASERRLGKSSDYTDITIEEAQAISIENSKYLGGDEHHTHLVKGLDLALLEKVRVPCVNAFMAIDNN
jgi:IK cytokine